MAVRLSRIPSTPSVLSQCLCRPVVARYSALADRSCRTSYLSRNLDISPSYLSWTHRGFATRLSQWFIDRREEKQQFKAEKSRYRKFVWKDTYNIGYSAVGELRQKKGKLFDGADDAVPPQNARTLPALRGHNAFNKYVRLREEMKGDVCVVVVTFRAYAEKALPDVENYVKEKCHKKARRIRIYAVENPVYALFRPFWKLVMRFATRKEDKRNTVYLTRSSTLHFRFMFELLNALPLYTMIVDRRGYVRWRASGTLTPREKIALAKILDELIENKQQGKDSKAPLKAGGAKLGQASHLLRKG